MRQEFFIMNIQKDFEEFLRLLNGKKVEYVIVGAYAVAFYGHVRMTKDLDILFRNTPQNIRKLRSALKQFGFTTDNLDDVAFSEQGKIIRMGVSPVMIELINAISGLSFDTAWKNRVQGPYGGIKVNFLSLQNLLRNKLASGRAKDIADVEELKKIVEMDE
jgi:predicted nucleotidyltransferase